MPALPALSDLSGGTTVDGTTLAGVVVNGALAPAGADGFTLTSANNQVLALTINGFAGGAGVKVNGPAALSNSLRGNKIGTTFNGNGAAANNVGVVISGGNNNTVGGQTDAERNVISGNTTDGVQILAGARNNTVQGNYIGLNAAGTAALPNRGDGVEVNAANNFIGGAAGGLAEIATPGNIISGNAGAGVRLTGPGATGNRVVKNRIGTDAAGTTAVPNGQGAGINGGANHNEIGGALAGDGNLISVLAEMKLLASGAWEKVDDVSAVATNRTLQILHAPSSSPAPQRFYRLVTPQQR